MIAGQLGKRFGIKIPLLIALTLTSLLTIAMPLFSEQFGYKGAMACRILQGLTQGFVYPSLQSLLGLWTPLSERTKYGSNIYAGNIFNFFINSPHFLLTVIKLIYLPEMSLCNIVVQFSFLTLYPILNEIPLIVIRRVEHKYHSVKS